MLDENVYIVTYEDNKKKVTKKFNSKVDASIFARKVLSTVEIEDTSSGGNSKKVEDTSVVEIDAKDESDIEITLKKKKKKH